ncbi:MAG: phosphoheptose isomerase, partial [Alphaproteobacteria bacterium]|nr:phosphoheptose isomerase [Alphaproteobacteria bacterium]
MNAGNLSDQATALVNQSVAVKERMLADDIGTRLSAMAEAVAAAIAGGGKVLLCGNGGSAG